MAMFLDTTYYKVPYRKIRLRTQEHPFHIVDHSPWPFTGAFGAASMAFGGVMKMHGFSSGGNFVLVYGLALVLGTMYGWWKDIVREATYEGQHTFVVQRGLRVGFVLFVISEVMFFAAFFWAFFHSSLSPSHTIGGVWPPVGINPLSPWEVPLLNTVILLSSGATVTWAHHAIIHGSRFQALISLFFTVVLAFVFTCLQYFEYIEAPFTIADGVYGSTFFMTTGFHGFHVIVGAIFLSVCLVRLVYHHFTTTHHFGLEAAAWYWHFVDVVWLFLFLAMYWWGGDL